MNTPSPAPMRRRRPQRQDAPQQQDIPQRQSPYDEPGTWDAPPLQRPADAYRPPAETDIPRARTAQVSGAARSAAVRPSATPSRRRASASGPLFSSLPIWLRLVFIFLCSAIFFTSVVAVTRDYLARQEERRRLEAEAAERAQYPLYYPELINQYAAAQGLDPALVAAVILCESSFDPQAESYLGARGLMQLMEDTASWIAHRLGEDTDGYTFDLLYDPGVNIRFGTWYLGYLSARFSGDPTKIVCAYHAGQGNVDSWLKNPEYSSDGVTLDVIPTADTATYASRVLRARDVYKKYYYSETDAPESGPVD